MQGRRKSAKVTKVVIYAVLRAREQECQQSKLLPLDSASRLIIGVLTRCTPDRYPESLFLVLRARVENTAEQ